MFLLPLLNKTKIKCFLDFPFRKWLMESFRVSVDFAGEKPGFQESMKFEMVYHLKR